MPKLPVADVNSMANLPAICGNPPRFSSVRAVGTPMIPDRDALHRRLDEMLTARRLTNDGPFVREFESRLSDINGGAAVVAVCNATVGLQLLVKALGLTGEVILPSFTFIATAHACFWEGLDPVFVDVDPVTHVIDPDRVAASVTERTAAVLGVHLWGRMCPVRELGQIANDFGLPVIYDAAHALGCTYGGVPAGRFGTASVVSFHATKFVQSLEGGAILTPDHDLADRLRLLRNFGFCGYDHVVSIGTNAKLDEFSAIMGIGSLEAFDALIAKNRSNRDAYRRALEGLPGLSVFEYDESEANNYQYLIVMVDPDTCPFTRDELITVLHADNVIARRYFYPGCHRSMPYKSLVQCRRASLPVTERLSDSVLALPTGNGVDANDIREIGSLLRVAFENASTVRRWLAAATAKQAA
jgi:dTDP-4-amino-4,6-dideoxygalactose transaminase